MTRRKQSTRWWLIVCVAAFGVLLMPPGCSKDPANPVTPVSPNPPAVLVELHGTVHYVDLESRSYKPFNGATVRLDSGTAGARTQVSDSAGNFLFAQVSQGDHHLQVSDSTLVILDTSVTVSQTSGLLTLVTRPPGLTFTGTVTVLDRSTSMPVPVSGAMVSLTGDIEPARSVYTNSQGMFTFPGVQRGTHRLQITHPTIFTLDTLVTVTGPGQTIACVARRAAVLKGAIQTHDRPSGTRQPLAGAKVSLDTGTVNVHLVETDASGGFTFTQVSEGVHHLRVSDPSVVTLDTQVVVSFSMADLALLVEALPLTEIFPLAVGASWVYDYLYRKEYYMDGSTKTHTWWQKGSIAFHVLGVSDEGSRRRWTILERDDLHLTDTLWFYDQVAVPPGDTSLTSEHVFSMYEESYGLHKLQADSCSVLWQSPQAAWALGTEAKSLSRYCLGETETFSLYQSIMHMFYLQDSLTFSRNVGLVRYEQRTGAGNISRYYDWTWGTLRSYTPGQVSSNTVMGKRP
jgi:hypothetical protein